MTPINCTGAAELAVFLIFVYLGARYIEPYLKHWRDQWWRKAQGKRVVKDWRNGDCP